MTDDPRSSPDHGDGGVVIGLLARHDDRDLAETLAAELPEVLRERIGAGARWRVEVDEVDAADPAAQVTDLMESIRRHSLDQGWQMGIGLTMLPLRDGRRPVTARASPAHGVGIVSVPALGAVRRGERLRRSAAEIVEALLGEAGAGRNGRVARMNQRHAELASPIGTADAERHGTLRFTRLVARGNLRLLIGMIRANRPSRVMARLSRSSTAALGTGAYALSSSNIWLLADQSSWLRLAGVALLSVVIILASMLVAHRLWERTDDPAARERVVLFNIVTITTLAIGVASLYVALFVLMTLAGLVVIPPSTLQSQIHHAPGFADFARLGWFVASVATVGGALGSLIESDGAVRAAAYRPSGSTSA